MSPTAPRPVGPRPLGHPGLPEGVSGLAARYAVEAWIAAPGDQPPLSDAELNALLWAPPTLEPDWPQPAEPIPVGDGWVHAEVTDDDQATFNELLDRWQNLPPDQFAAGCQELRLPVCPYRALDRSPSPADIDVPAAVDVPADLDQRREHQPKAARRAARLRVVDLSTHWAGPLATKLLACRGAEVVKVDPACRPDGFRDRPELYRHLNGGKEIVDLDLRRPSDRERFESLLDGADLLVESFSRRVMGNLGYGPANLGARFPNLRVLSIKAFPVVGPQAHWLAFGPGVHAASGLAFANPAPDHSNLDHSNLDHPNRAQPAQPRSGGAPVPAPIAYPDFLAGLAGFAAARRLTAAPVAAATVEITLAGAIAPLVSAAMAADHRRSIGGDR